MNLQNLERFDFIAISMCLLYVHWILLSKISLHCFECAIASEWVELSIIIFFDFVFCPIRSVHCNSQRFVRCLRNVLYAASMAICWFVLRDRVDIAGWKFLCTYSEAAMFIIYSYKQHRNRWTKNKTRKAKEEEDREEQVWAPFSATLAFSHIMLQQ